jgi:hypothetical protein
VVVSSCQPSETDAYFNILKERWQEKSNVKKKKKKKVRRSKTKMDIMEMITRSIERCRAHESVAHQQQEGDHERRGCN